MAEAARVAVILAGGSGERFWPLSTPERPKQLLNLADPKRSLLQQSLDRAEPLVGRNRCYVVTGAGIASAIEASDLLPRNQVFVEPKPINTLGALCWAVSRLKRLGYEDDTIVAVLTADHAISEVEAFQRNVRTAMSLAEQMDALVTIGIPPDRPEIGYGYIHRGEPVDGGYRALRFVEKPSAEVAQSYLDSGEYLWNSGMFFWSIGAFTSEMRRHRPEIAEVLERLPTEPEAFDLLPSEPIDKALMERSDNIVVTPAEFSWDDVGSWDALDRIARADENGNVLAGFAEQIAASNNIVFSDGLPIGIIGVEDLVVVATANGVLVCRKADAQRVREIVARLKTR